MSPGVQSRDDTPWLRTHLRETACQPIGGGDERGRGPRGRCQRADLNARRYRQPPLAGAQAKGGLSATRLPGTTTNPMNLDKGAAEPSLPASASRPPYSRREAEAGSTSISVITGPSNTVIVLTHIITTGADSYRFRRTTAQRKAAKS